MVLKNILKKIKKIMIKFNNLEVIYYISFIFIFIFNNIYL
jgi:hypothetical protein